MIHSSDTEYSLKLLGGGETTKGLVLFTWVVVILTNVLLIVLIVNSVDHPVYDEGWWINTLSITRKHGILTRAFLLELPGAAGPTFTVIYAGLQKVLNLTYPWLRLVNYAFLLASALSIWVLLRLGQMFLPENSWNIDAALVAGSVTALPSIGAAAGLTLTEMPAIFLMLLFLIGFLMILRLKQQKIVAAGLCIVCGAVAAAAIMGRQNYLLVLPCLPLLVRINGMIPDRIELAYCVITCTVALALVLPVFAIWGGLVPPTPAGAHHGVSIWNGVLSLGYAGVAAAILAPDLFRALFVRGRDFAFVVVGAIALSLLAGEPILPMRTVLSSIADDTALRVLGLAFAIMFAILGLSFLYCMARHIWMFKADRMIRFSSCVLILGVMSNTNVTWQFSSRYVVMFIPFLVLALAPTIRLSWHFPIRLLVGATISLGSLSSYYIVE
jgi:hypothetical protein